MQPAFLNELLLAKGKELEMLGSLESAQERLGFCAKAGALAFVGAWLLWNLFFDAPLEGAIFSFLCAFGVSAIVWGTERRAIQKRDREIERHLPFALMQASVELNLGRHFDDCLARIAKSNYGAFSTEVLAALARKARLGESVPNCLRWISSRSFSHALKRAIAQMVFAYEHGEQRGKGNPIRRVAVELLARQKSEARKFMGQMAFLSLAFIAVSAIVPAMFSAFISIGSSFMEIGFSPLQVIAITAIGFPLLDLTLIFYIKSLVPEFLKV
ncbi:MAG: hypothetical protein NUV67_00570 [archaeon]|nr:hypothetical protein [archaeon]